MNVDSIIEKDYIEQYDSRYMIKINTNFGETFQYFSHSVSTILNLYLCLKIYEKIDNFILSIQIYIKIENEFKLQII